MALHQYPHCTAIKIATFDNDAAAPDDTTRVGDFLTLANADLDMIRQTQVGAQLFNSLATSNFKVIVKCIGRGMVVDMTRQACISSYQTNSADEADGVNALVRYFLKELTSGLGYILTQALDDATQDGFNAARLAVGGPLNRGLTYAQLQNVAQGDAVFDKAQVLQASVALERWLPDGEGCDSSVTYDPWLAFGAGPNDPRPATVGLYHELVHAWYYARGTYAVPLDENVTFRKAYEDIAIGAGPIGTGMANHPGFYRQFSENKYRLEIGLKLRGET